MNKIQSPRDPDIATSLGSAQYGLAQSLVHRPLGSPTIIASKSYVLGIGANLETGLETSGVSNEDAGKETEMSNRKRIFEYVCMF